MHGTQVSQDQSVPGGAGTEGLSCGRWGADSRAVRVGEMEGTGI